MEDSREKLHQNLLVDAISNCNKTSPYFKIRASENHHMVQRKFLVLVINKRKQDQTNKAVQIEKQIVKAVPLVEIFSTLTL